MRFDLDKGDITTSVIPGSSFKYSAVKADKLGAVEQTLATIAIDTSGSMSQHEGKLLTMLNTIVDACKKSPRRENMIVRVLTFDDKVSEIHGFIPLNSIVQYQQSDLHCKGMTTLYDATLNAVAATRLYGEDLVKQDYDVNGIVFIATDGADNKSSYTPGKIASEIEDISKSETIGDITTILIDMSPSSLETFKVDAKLSSRIEFGDITSGKLAKLANFVSKSISSSSQALATGTSVVIAAPTF
jgi:uncharacterized protein YegL